MKLSRRFVLKGLGATVAIPVLPSLLTATEARAQAMTPKPNFVAFSTNHGGIWARNMFPSLPTSGVETKSYAGRTLKRFPLVATRANGVATLSPVLSAPDTQLTPALLGKMFSVQGVDVPFYLAHNTGGCLGNFSRNDANGSDGTVAQANAQRRTIDQIMGWSSAFYPDLSAVRQRVMIASSRMSYNYANPTTRTGALQEIAGVASPNALFDQLFPQTGGPAARAPIVDKVLESYTKLRTSPRLSKADKDRLDDHVQRLSEVQRRLGTTVTCGAVTRPASPFMATTLGDVMYSQQYALDPAAHAAFFQAFNDVITLAFGCGVSRIAIARLDPIFSTFAGDWHQDVAHQADQPDGAKQDILWQAHQRSFANVVVDLAKKLDGVDAGNGSTLLDQSLVSWTQECGNQTHSSTTIPVIGFGGAAGYLKTGYHHDYRNLAQPFSTSDTDHQYAGLLWQQWLGTVLQAMRVPKAEWENPAVNGGYPDYNYQALNWVSVTADQAWPAATWAATGEVLPWLKA